MTVQRKAYVPAAVALLAALLAACTGGSGDGSAQDDKAGGTATSAPVAQPGRYSTLSDACTVADHDQLDALLPGLKLLTDEEQREKAYDGTATLTYDNDRRSGCRWKAESDSASDQLYVDFERIVSYDASVSDDDSAARVFGEKADAADIPHDGAVTSVGPNTTSSGSPSQGSGAPASGKGSKTSQGSKGSKGAKGTKSPDGAGHSGSGSPDPSPGATDSASVLPRLLEGLGDEAYLDDDLSPTQQRTVTVVFRTSNVIVTVQYEEQPTRTGTVAGSKEMQDRAQNLARQLADSFEG
ncbi:putative small secreted protein [Streptomyces sp. B3I7]|nr:putative small secreted protein [Streptomyces sp. B3I7]